MLHRSNHIQEAPVYQFEEISQLMVRANEALFGSAARVGQLAVERQHALLEQQTELARK